MTDPQEVSPSTIGVAHRSRPTGTVQPTSLPGPDALLLAVGVMVLTFCWRIQDLFPVIGKASPALLATLVGITLYGLDADSRRRPNRLRSPVLRWLVILVALMLLSIPGSLWVGQSVRFMYEDFAFTIVLVALMALAVRTRRDVEWYAGLHVVGALFYSVVLLTRGKVGSDGRIGGLRYYDANDLGLVLVCTLPLAVYFLRREVRPWLRLTALLALALLALTIVKTGSRGAFLGFVAVMVYILFQFHAIKKRTRITAAVAGVGVMLAVGSEAYWLQIQTLLRPQEDYNMSENNLAGRSAVWKRGMGYMFQNPMLGVGVRCFSQAEGMLSEAGQQQAASGRGFKWSAAHNSFVEIGAENGIPALIVFVTAIVVSIKTMNGLRKRLPRGAPVSADAALGQAIVGSLIGFCVSGFFLSHGYSAYLYSLFGMAIGLSKLHPRAAPAREARRVPAARGGGIPVPPSGAV